MLYDVIDDISEELDIDLKDIWHKVRQLQKLFWHNFSHLYQRFANPHVQCAIRYLARMLAGC